MPGYVNITCPSAVTAFCSSPRGVAILPTISSQSQPVLCRWLSLPPIVPQMCGLVGVEKTKPPMHNTGHPLDNDVTPKAPSSTPYSVLDLPGPSKRCNSLTGFIVHTEKGAPLSVRRKSLQVHQYSCLSPRQRSACTGQVDPYCVPADIKIMVSAVSLQDEVGGGVARCTDNRHIISAAKASWP